MTTNLEELEKWIGECYAYDKGDDSGSNYHYQQAQDIIKRLSDDEIANFIRQYVRWFLTAEARQQRYGWEDVRASLEWFRDFSGFRLPLHSGQGLSIIP